MAGNHRRRHCAVLLFLFAAFSMAGGEFITWEDFTLPAVATVARGTPVVDDGGVKSSAPRRGGMALSTIVVSQDGTGHSRTVQGAVDMVPAGNTRRVKILVRPGIYR